MNLKKFDPKKADKIGQKWEKSFHDHSYEIKQVGKEFFESFADSKYIKLMVNYSGIKKGDRVLEAGCGSGKLSVVMATLGYKVTALDFSERMLKNVWALKQEAQKYFGRLDLECVRGDLGNLKLPTTYDLVFNEGVVEHWLNKEDRAQVIKEMVKVTKTGGRVAVFVPNGGNPLHFWWVVSRYSGYTSAPKMTRYNTNILKKEMEEAGLKDLYTDGLDVYYTFNKWPHLSLLDYPIGYIEKRMLPPKWLREVLGTNIVCLGRKI